MNYNRIVLDNKELVEKFLKGKIHSLEDSNNELYKFLDFSGIDLIFVSNEGFIYNIACRISFSDFKSIGIRYDRASGVPTEYDKTIKAIKKNSSFSQIGLHINVINGDIIRMIKFDRLSLFNVLDKIENKDPFLTRRLDVDGVRFFNIPYSFLKHNNIFFEEYSPQQLLF